VGDGRQIEDYLKVIKDNPDLGLKVKAWVDSKGIADNHKILSIPEFDESLMRQLGSDYVVVGYSFKDYAKVDKVLKICSNELLNITVLPDISYSLIGHDISDFAGIPVISINQPKFSSKSIIIKRLFDFILSGIGLVLISPLLALIAVGVKLSSPGPILFGQRRIGLDGKEFLMWKFRSMKVDSEANGAGWTTASDPRKTKFGSFIRKTSLDELPQLWNVFIGEMSLVGPRPEQPYFVEKFKGEIPAYMLRHKMKAGITGWAQVNGWRGDTSIASRIECDIWYIKNWSIWLDIGIIFMTFWKGIINKNAY
jgi:Undecaprenyl-phosphate glucose phosphotransferase